MAVEVICETNVSPIVHRDSNRGRLLMEGLFAHFFSPHRPSYHANDCRWFLELANRQHHWQPGFVDQSIVASGLGDNVMKEQEQSSSGLLQVGLLPSLYATLIRASILPMFPLLPRYFLSLSLLAVAESPEHECVQAVPGSDLGKV